VTGGSVFFHPRFDATRDRARVNDEIQRVLVRDIAYNVAIRIRCSNGESTRNDPSVKLIHLIPGLRVQNHIGNFHQRSLTDLEAGTMDSEQSLGAVLRHDGKLDERSMAFIQAAVLYTTATGERRVRTMNLSFPITNHIGNLFKFSDFDTGMALLYKDGKQPASRSRALADSDLSKAVTQALTKNLNDVRRGLTERCVRVMAMYRKHVAVPTSMGQVGSSDPFLRCSLTQSRSAGSAGIVQAHANVHSRDDQKQGPERRSSGCRRALPLHPIDPVNVVPANHDEPLSTDVRSPRFARGGRVLGRERAFGATAVHAYFAFVHGGGWRIHAQWVIKTAIKDHTDRPRLSAVNGEVAMLWLGHALSPQIINDLYAVENLDDLDIRIVGILSMAFLRLLTAHLDPIA
jgi:protein transport protein SEC24